MSNLSENSLAILGQEVPLGRVDKALKELWGADAARTRASLMNIAVYSEDPESLERNTQLLGEITREHSCRGLLILALPDQTPPLARAWITAHCQLYDGHKSVCSEQISFVLAGGNANQVRNIVFAHLDSDLPLVFCWQGDLTANFDERLYSVIDLLFVDSSTWCKPEVDFDRLQQATAQKTARFRVYDLSWLRSHSLRTALATCFQDQVALAQLPHLQKMEITHATGHRIAALLMAAWVAVRLECTLDICHNGLCLVTAEGQRIEVTITDNGAGDPLQGIFLHSNEANISVTRSNGAPHAKARVEIGDHVNEELLPADLGSDSELIGGQLARLGGQSLYFQMVPMLRGMLQRVC
jgi:glucose-6-phosphate dehydrogenase assembly protein OpcA